VVVSAAIDLHRLAVGAEQAHALAALHLADARERDAEHVGELGDALARDWRRGEAELVVVAARDDRGAARVGAKCFAPIADTGIAASSTVAPTPDRRQMWPRSASSPSEMSIAAVAMPRSAWPERHARRGLVEAHHGFAVVGLREHELAVAMRDRERRVADVARDPDVVAGLRAAARSAAPAGTSPMIVTVSVSGPRVVSPPMSETLNSAARSKKPLAKAASHSWSTRAA
jgi:hypothetical protein